MPLLETKALRVEFGGVQALDGVDFHVDVGEIVSVIGPNGAGKTTMLRILSGDEEPDGGEIHRRRHLRVAMVTQEDVFDPKDTVLEVATRGASSGPEGAEDETERQVRVSIALDQPG